jgi:uncharacterized protein (TIGR02145 family)
MQKSFRFYRIFTIVFLLQLPACCKVNEGNLSTTVSDIDGNAYKTIKIGDQWWMAENLKTTKYDDGTVIPNVTDPTAWCNITSGAYCIYENDINNAPIYGHLYNFYAVLDTRKLCPAGWHVPSDDEWKTLEMYLGMTVGLDDIGERGTTEGGKLKETGYEHWFSPNEGATNESGFTALPGSFRNSQGVTVAGFYPKTLSDQNAVWWTSTEGYYRALHHYNSTIYRYYYWYSNGFSVRCIKD